MKITISRQNKLCGVVSSGVTLLVMLPLLIGCSSTQATSASHQEAGKNPNPIQDWAKACLAKSPRHQEWVKVKNGNREVNCFVVYPEVKNKATAVVVIHEIFGMSDWGQVVTDEMAEAGFVAIAPDLLSGMWQNGGGTSEIAATGSNAVGGFCWGGSQTFRFATNRPGLKAAFVFYGSAPTTGQLPNQTHDKEALKRIVAPVYGFYAENDARINATIPSTTNATKELGKSYEPATYAGAGHGFMRAGDAPEPVAPAVKGGKKADAKAAADYQKELATYKVNKKACEDA